MAAVLSEHDKARARHHLGYLQVEAAQTFVLGVPAGVQTQFMSEGAFNRVLPSGVDRFLRLLCRLDEIEEEVYCGVDLASVNKIGDIEVNPDRLKELAKYYKFAQQGLANMLGITANPFDMREWLQGGNINVPVING